MQFVHIYRHGNTGRHGHVLKGTIFFGFNDLALNQPAPSSAAMQAQAQIVLGRLP
jgi:hypothetical protein